MNENVFLFGEKLYEKTTKYLTRLSNSLDYYSTGEKINENCFVLVPFSKCPFYTVESVVLYNPREVKSIKIEKHFTKNHFATPISFSPNYQEFNGYSSRGHFFRKCFIVLESNSNELVYQYIQLIPVTPRTIQQVAKRNNKTYTDYLYKLKKECPNVTIFNLHGGSYLCNEELESIT